MSHDQQRHLRFRDRRLCCHDGGGNEGRAARVRHAGLAVPASAEPIKFNYQNAATANEGHYILVQYVCSANYSTKLSCRRGLAWRAGFFCEVRELEAQLVEILCHNDKLPVRLPRWSAQCP